MYLLGGFDGVRRADMCGTPGCTDAPRLLALIEASWLPISHTRYSTKEKSLLQGMLRLLVRRYRVAIPEIMPKDEKVTEPVKLTSRAYTQIDIQFRALRIIEVTKSD